MDGRRWTDSTFWRSATRGEDQWWLRLAGWQRAAARIAGMWLLLILAPAFFLLHALRGWSPALLLLAAHAGLAAAWWLPVLTYRLIRDRGLSIRWYERVETERGQEWRRSSRTLVRGRRRWLEEKVRPVARSVATKVGRRYHPKEAAQWVHVPHDYREPGGGAVEILLPQTFTITTEAARRSLANLAAERLGIREPQFSYDLEGNAPRLTLTAPVLPPDFVSFSDMLPALRAASEYTFVLGMLGHETMSVSLKDDSPHLALSAGSGAGKSELIKELVAQVLHWGWSVLILDWKEESQEWADGLPGVRYVRSIEALHDTCVEIGEEVEWRKAHRMPATERKKMLVVSEEWGITAPLLAEYWAALRSTAEPEERRAMPLKSPAATALMKLNFTGRSLGMCQLLVAQRFSARVTNGNADLRESFTTIFMSRWKAQTFKMLAPDVRPIPRKLTKPGQWLAVTGDEVARFQSGLWSDEEAREWATSGVAPPLSPWSERYEGELDAAPVTRAVLTDECSADQREQVASDTAGRKEITSHTTTPLRLRGLRDIAESLEHLAITHNILRNASREDAKGDKDFPKPAGGTPTGGYLYDVTAVTDWARKKRAKESAEQFSRNS